MTTRTIPWIAAAFVLVSGTVGAVLLLRRAPVARAPRSQSAHSARRVTPGAGADAGRPAPPEVARSDAGVDAGPRTPSSIAAENARLRQRAALIFRDLRRLHPNIVSVRAEPFGAGGELTMLHVVWASCTSVSDVHGLARMYPLGRTGFRYLRCEHPTQHDVFEQGISP